MSGLAFPKSIPARAVDLAIASCSLLFSVATFSELSEVLARRKFDRYISLEKRREALQFVATKALFVSVKREVSLCRDPRDDKFLSLALAGNAKYLVTGDLDLLAQDPFGSCRILKPADFLNR